MRSVLGDRRKTFTWFGSVTDSVVGAFLTQNVSDALSSRAYMEVASRWPAQHNGGKALSSVFSSPFSSSSGRSFTLSDEADTVDWEAVRTVSINELADAIRCRGMQMVLSNNIQAFLNHLRRYNLLKKAVQVAANGGFRGVETDVIATVDSMMDGILEKAQKEERNQVGVVLEELVESVAIDSSNPFIRKEGSIAGSGYIQSSGHRSVSSRSHISLAYDEEEVKVKLNKETPSGLLTQEQQQHENSLAAARLLSSEWLRDAPDDEARDFLMSINGLGRKSVACIMLLTLGKKEFPVDTNVGRICSRLGWIPLDAAESIEELDDYAPEPEVHAYLRSRLLGFDVETLYELHYQMITLGKVFCSKHSPNCTACPMQKECEYALHKGPSLHGRKRSKVSKPDDVFNNTTAMPGGEGTNTTTTGLTNESFSRMPKSHLPGSSRLPPAFTNSPTSKSIHWRTRQKLDRLAQEKSARELAVAEHARLYSSLDLEELVYTRITRPRSRNLRRPRGSIKISQLQRQEEEVGFQAGVARWQQIYPINWLNLETMELGVKGLLPASVWDRAVAMEMDQQAGNDFTNGTDGAVTATNSVNERLTAWEEALNNASSTLQYSNRGVTIADEASISPSDVVEQGNHLSIWDLAGKSPPPRTPPLTHQQQQLEVESTGPPILVKSKPVVDQGNELEENPALRVKAAEEEDGAAATAVAVADVAAPVDCDNDAVDFIPTEEMTELDIMNAEIAEILPELLAWVPGSDLCVTDDASQQLSKLDKEEGTPLQDAVTLPVHSLPTSLPSSPSDIQIECCRLQQLARELAVENEVMLKIEQGVDASLHRKCLLELSLQALNFDLSLSVDSAESVVTAARSNYRQLARALHPDKCKLPGAADAFSGLAMAMRIVSEYSLEKEQQEKDTKEAEQSGEEPYLDVEGGGKFSRPPARAATNPSPAPVPKTLEHRIVWNQSRLVVAAHILPPHVHSTFAHLQNAAGTPTTTTTAGGGGGGDYDEDEQQVMFLPMINIPTFQREKLAGRRSARMNRTATSGSAGGDVELVLDYLVNAVCEGAEGDVALIAAPATLPASEREDEMVEGMLLVTCRAALRGRFPLNGTYFQINELFADHQTAVEAITVSKHLLVTIRTFFLLHISMPAI
jgi:endonuclease III